MKQIIERKIQLLSTSSTGTVVEETAVTVVEKPETLAAPTGLSSASGREEVTISWEPVESTDITISFYRVYYGPSKQNYLQVQIH